MLVELNVLSDFSGTERVVVGMECLELDSKLTSKLLKVVLPFESWFRLQAHLVVCVDVPRGVVDVDGASHTPQVR